MAYLLDANVFIQAKNLHYGFDFCPAFWDWLDLANQQGQVFSIEKVFDELIAGNDELAKWAEQHADVFFLQPDAKVLAAFGQVSQWVSTQGYEQSAISTFFQIADYYLVAHALAHHFIVVTHEVPAGTKKRVKIPDICIGLDIRHMTPYEMLRREGARFVLEMRVAGPNNILENRYGG
jgi:predicted nucleic acid-binding protein